MNTGSPIWLVTNASSGSNDDAALAALEDCCVRHSFELAARTIFPQEDLPTPDRLQAVGVELVAAFAGDGTINTLISGLAGWEGSVLVLPGGTMNLLYHRLHGDRPLEEAVAAVAGGEATVRRPGVVRSPCGDAFAGMLAGPGTRWGRVREAMREADLVELASGTIEAVDETLTGELIACTEPAFGRAEGYPLISLTPHDDGIEVEAYHAETAKDYLDHAWALLRRQFREGPHDVLGHARTVRLSSTRGNPFGLLIDGEEAEAPPELEFTLAAAEVDLLATKYDGD